MSTAAPVAADRPALIRGLEQEVGVMIRRIRRLIGERARSVHPEMQGPTYLMLSMIEAQGPVRASTIAEAFGIDKGAVSRQVQHLIELGLVDRSPDPDDGRATLLSASPVAVERLEQVKEDSRVWLDARLGDLADDDLEDFVRLLGRYNAALEA